MKLLNYFVLICILINIFISTVSANKEANQKNEKNEKSENKSTSTTNNENKKNAQVIVSNVRTHQYVEADEVPSGSIINSVLHSPIPTTVVSRPVAPILNRAPTVVSAPVGNILNRVPAPTMLSHNEWSIPFPVVKPVQTTVPRGVAVVNAVVNRPLINPPFGNAPISVINRPVSPINIGGVPPTSVPILKPLAQISSPGIVVSPRHAMGVLRGVSSFSSNYSGPIDSIDDIKISSNQKNSNKNNI